MRVTAERMAGSLYLVAMAAALAIWYLLLFVGNAPGHGPLDALRHALLEDADRAFFWGLLALPVVCLVLAWAHFSGLTHARRAATAILVLGVLVAVACWILLDWVVSLLVTLPLVFAAQGRAWRRTVDAPGGDP